MLMQQQGTASVLDAEHGGTLCPTCGALTVSTVIRSTPISQYYSHYQQQIISKQSVKGAAIGRFTFTYRIIVRSLFNTNCAKRTVCILPTYVKQMVGVTVSPVGKHTHLEAGLVDRFAVLHACYLMGDGLLLGCIPIEHLLN